MAKKKRFKGFFADFKNFVFRGNIVDLAVAVIIGGAFGKIVTSFVNDIVMPLITLLVGGKSVADWKWVIKEANEAAGTAETALMYGNFIQTVIDFLIIAFFIFLALRLMMSLKQGAENLNNKERKAAVKELKAQGLNGPQIEEEFERRAAERKKAEEEAAKPETSEQILADIRELLAARNAQCTTRNDGEE